MTRQPLKLLSESIMRPKNRSRVYQAKTNTVLASLMLTLCICLFSNATLAHSAIQNAKDSRLDIVTTWLNGERVVRFRNDARDQASGFSRTQSKPLKSRRQVIAEVERQYRAKVLKVTLNESRGVYNVRILQSDGRVRTVQVSAY